MPDAGDTILLADLTQFYGEFADAEVRAASGHRIGCLCGVCRATRAMGPRTPSFSDVLMAHAAEAEGRVVSEDEARQAEDARMTKSARKARARRLANREARQRTALVNAMLLRGPRTRVKRSAAA